MRVLILLASLVFSFATQAAAKNTLVNWQDWSPQVFEKAAAQNKLILLEMEAVWCHWCHVMDQDTYSQQAVADYIHQYFIPVRVDHDARPDLANRYREWGWPATIILKADGTELVKRAGYIAANPFQNLLAAVVADPTPEASALLASEPEAASSSLSPAIRKELARRFVEQSDVTIGGLKIALKFIEPGAQEYALAQAVNVELSDAEASRAKRIAKSTFDGALNLLDPVWGGVYQYSTHGDWQHPHYEKLASTQARYLRLYALGAAAIGDPQYARASGRIADYLQRFLTDPSGAFYTSQDADLMPGKKAHGFFASDNKQRLEQGMPRVDKNIYARENGLLIEALLRWHQYQSEPRGLTLATAALTAIIKTHQRGDGYSHAATDKKALFLEDNLAMAKALLAMYEVTAERAWLTESIKAANFIEKNLKHPIAGWLDAQPSGPLQPQLGIDINVATGRFFSRLYHYSGDARWRGAAEHAMRYLSAESVALSRIEDSDILLFDLELNRPPLHYAVVASKRDGLASKLFVQGLQDPVAYKRIEWWDRAEGPLMHNDVPYPAFPMAAAYVCTDKRCSAPAFDEATWRSRKTDLLRRP